MSTIAARLGKEYPEDAKKEIGVAPVHEYLVKNFRPTLYLLFGGVSLILLIACANVANLLLAKSVSRRQEMAVRTALGARPSDIFHQLIAESLVLALPAAALGLLLGFAGARVFTAMNPANPRIALGCEVEKLLQDPP